MITVRLTIAAESAPTDDLSDFIARDTGHRMDAGWSWHAPGWLILTVSSEQAHSLSLVLPDALGISVVLTDGLGRVEAAHIVRGELPDEWEGVPPKIRQMISG